MHELFINLFKNTLYVKKLFLFRIHIASILQYMLNMYSLKIHAILFSGIIVLRNYY